MTRLILLLVLSGCSSEESVPGRTPPPAETTQQPAPAPTPAAAPQGPETKVPAPVTQRPEANPTVQRALVVIDSLIRSPLPGQASRSEGRALAEQNAWFKTLRDRLQNLLALVVAPAKVEQPAPVEDRHLKALQEEAEKESLQQPGGSAALKARHDIVMEAIRNMKA